MFTFLELFFALIVRDNAEEQAERNTNTHISINCQAQGGTQTIIVHLQVQF